MPTGSALAVVPEQANAVAESAQALMLNDPALEFIQTLGPRWNLAKMLHASGMSRQRTPEGVMAVVLKGYELGLPPMAALANIDFFDGNFTIRAHAQLAIASSRYEVRPQVLQRDEKACRLMLTRPGWEPVETSFTHEQASTAGLLGKDNWKKYKVQMLYNRALADGIKMICPEVGAGIYDPDEVGAAAAPALPAGAFDGEAGADSTGEESAAGTSATPAQLALIEKVMQSHVFTNKEKKGLQKRIDRGMTKEQANEAADWLLTQVKERKDAEKAEAAEAADAEPEFAGAASGTDSIPEFD